RSANRLSGWISYAHTFTRVRDGITGVAFPSDFDSTNAVRAFATYRLTSSVNLSGRFVYATGLPLPGFFELRNGITYISAERNSLRLPLYQRTDFRINKAFVKRRTQFTLFAEVVNLTNHKNIVFESLNSYNPVTGQARVSVQRTFPILPAAGL